MAQPKSVGELLRAFLAGKLSDALPLEARLQETWKRLMGPEIAAATAAVRYRRGKVLVQLTDPLLREELRYHGERLAEMLRAAGFPEVKQVEIR